MFGFVAAGLVGLANCSDGGGPPAVEKVDAARQPLQTTVSDPFDLEDLPTDFDGGLISNEKLVCGSQRCMLFYEQNFDGWPFLMATRVGSDGSIQDYPRLVLGRSSLLYSVAASGDDFMVNYIPHDPSAPGTTAATLRIHGEDGRFEDVSSALDATLTTLVGGDGTWLAYRNNSITVLDTDLQPVGASFSIAPQGVLRAFHGDGQYLVTWPGFAVRVDEETGARLDASPIQFSRYTTGVTEAVFVNGTWQLAWLDDHDLYGSRIAAGNGEVLDPDDTFNQVSGAELLCNDCSSVAGNAVTMGTLHLSVTGGDAFATWTHLPYNSQWRLFGARIDVGSGQRRQGAASSAELEIGTINAQLVSLSGAGNLALGSTNTYAAPTITKLDVVAAPFDVNLGASHDFAQATPERLTPAVAYNGATFLVTYVTAGTVRATRVHATTGAYLDDPPLTLGAGKTPVVAAQGSDFLVAWVGADDTLQRRVVHANGTMAVTVTPAIAGGETYDDEDDLEITRPRLISNGKYHLLTWVRDVGQGDIRGIRLDSAGAAVGSVVELAASRASYTTMADSIPDEAMRTFLLVRSDDDQLVVRRFRSESGAVISEETTIPAGRFPHGVSDGTNLLAIYRTGSQYDVASSFIDPVSGALQAGSPALLQDHPNSGGATEGAFYDGVSYVLINYLREYGFLTSDLTVQRFAKDRSPLDGELGAYGTLVVSDLIRNHDAVAVGSNGQGRSLIVYQMLDPMRLGYVLKARFLVNDGLAAPPEPDGGGGHGGADSSGNAGTAGSGDETGGRPDAAAGGPDGTAGSPDGTAGSGDTGAAGDGTGAVGGNGVPTSGASGGGTRATTGGAGSSAGSPNSGARSGSPDDESSSDDGGCGCSVPVGRNGWLSSIAALALVAAYRGRRARRLFFS